MRRKPNPPDYPRFTYARRRAYQLLCQLELDALPIDPWDVAARFPDICICKWTELRANTPYSDPLDIAAEGADAKTKHIRGDFNYLMVYDDRETNYQRVRWTIAHEIAHIMLGHLLEFEATALSRGGLTEDEYQTLEREADCFAANLLAPMTVILRIPRLTDKWELMDVCDLSETAAGHCMEERGRLQSGQRIPYPLPEEDILHRRFFHFIKYANHEPITFLRREDVAVGEEYDDYIECDYWEFVVMAMGKRQRDTELAAALTGSLAMYDYENMVIFIVDEDSIPLIEQAEGLIVDALIKYAESSVRHIAVRQAVFC